MRRCDRPLPRRNSVRSSCMIDEFTETCTKSVILCGCTAQSLPMTTERCSVYAELVCIIGHMYCSCLAHMYSVISRYAWLVFYHVDLRMLS